MGKSDRAYQEAIRKEFDTALVNATRKLKNHELFTREQQQIFILLSRIYWLDRDKKDLHHDIENPQDFLHDNDFIEYIKEILNIDLDKTIYGHQDRQTATVHAATLFHHTSAIDQSSTPCRFVLSDALMLGFILTGLENTYGEDLHFPFDTFFIELPPNVIELYHEKTKYHPVTYICVSKTTHPTFGPNISWTVMGQANENSVHPLDDCITYGSVFLSSQGKVNLEDSVTIRDLFQIYLEQYIKENNLGRAAITGNIFTPAFQKEMKQLIEKKIEEIEDPAEEIKKHRNYYPQKGRIFGEPIEGIEFKGIINRIIVNTLLYIASPSAKITHGNQTEIDRLAPLARGKKGQKMKARQAQQKIEDLEQEQFWNLETNVSLDPDLVRAYSRERLGTGTARTHSWITRGHWRRQHYGKGNLEIKLKWIFPYVSLKGMPPTSGHEYEVKNPT
jgi:hypothetical protein